MRQFLVATSLASLVSLGLMGAPLGAKPADLPADDKIKCPDGQEKGEHGGIAIDLDALSGRIDPAPSLDGISPFIIGAWLERCFDAVANLVPAPPDARAQQARQAFEAAERAQRAGDFASARTRYQQVHFLTPTSRLGSLAIDRIIEIEQHLRDAGEEAEPAAPNPQQLPMRRGSEDGYQPLGLVELTY